eukprot:CAMPEP_0183318522 /NCGR_PEP_ID=MMETSP0160_2-20130417/60961_1 /TAXON_ID=2839 ORGANISM="Odontella Sinensis, Strain Grunow 1884" /NCGR_SAMPLE_ID=MMETSP0160_2 /ASSEMBLY_ACC=CAM_ASM_000250 /LENGTH=239 /DNA_ID=CAMNT_0025484803 /DNA_START=130 /DNA_END=845 /DNA_ORIENTATION=-
MDHQQHPQPQQQRGEASSSSSSFSCRLLPHGGYTLIPATLSTMAWVASLAQDGCDYAKLTGPIVSEMTTSSSSSSSFPYLEVGFNAFRAPVLKSDGTWVVDYDSQCLQYDPLYVTMDNYWTAAKLAEFLSLVFGGGGAAVSVVQLVLRVQSRHLEVGRVRDRDGVRVPVRVVRLVPNGHVPGGRGSVHALLRVEVGHRGGGVLVRERGGDLRAISDAGGAQGPVLGDEIGEGGAGGGVG